MFWFQPLTSIPGNQLAIKIDEKPVSGESYQILSDYQSRYNLGITIVFQLKASQFVILSPLHLHRLLHRVLGLPLPGLPVAGRKAASEARRGGHGRLSDGMMESSRIKMKMMKDHGLP